MSNLLATEREGDSFRFTLTMTESADAADDAARLSALLTPFLDKERVDPMGAAAVHTAIEELLTNLGKFGRQGPDAPPASEPLVAEGRLAIVDGDIELAFGDNGSAFDPTSLPDPVFTDDPEQLVTGGLGLHMLRTMFTDFHYERASGRNCTLWRRNRDMR